MSGRHYERRVRIAAVLRRGWVRRQLLADRFGVTHDSMKDICNALGAQCRKDDDGFIEVRLITTENSSPGSDDSNEPSGPAPA